MPVITLLTDFGFKDGFTGVMHGVILGIAPSTQIVDITHAVGPQNILEGSLVLANAVPYFPPGTIHVAVVDPGVGTNRRPLAARIGEQVFVGPDNGLFTRVIEAAGKAGHSMTFYHLTKPEYWLQEVSRSFHGRDIFAPAAAHLAAGVPIERMGEPITDPARIMIPRPEATIDGWAGQVLAVDHFGNLLTNLGPEHLSGEKRVVIKVGEARIDGLVETFGEREPGSVVAMVDSSGVLEIAVVNDGRIIADMNADELVSSDILTSNGIREPLYVTAMKYAKIKVTPDMKPGHIWSLDTSKVNKELRKWSRSVKHPDLSNHNESILKVDHLSFSYDGLHKTLREIDFDLREGEMVSIVGKNGAGKSTLSKIMVGFEKEDKGAVLYRSEDLKKKSIKQRAEFIGVVMQNPNQMISKTLIYDEVALGLRLRHVSEEEIKPRVKKVLDVCGLAPFIEWPISALSYGQKKRVTIASILVLDPRILILDEPTAGQDYRHYSEIMEFLREINKLGITIILITHDMHLMLEHTPRAIVLSEGDMVADTRASVVLTDKDMIEKANLKETSLYHLAELAGIPDKTQFVQNFIDYERSLTA